MLSSLRFTICAILRIRAAQTWRMLKDIGFLRLLVVLLLTTVFLCGLYIYTFEPSSAIVVSLLFVGILALIQMNRPDKKFLATQLPHYHLFTSIEYLLLSTPLTFCLLFHHHFITMVATLLMSMLIPYLNLSVRTITINSGLQKLIPDSGYEWKAGVRKAFLPLCFIWLLALGTSWFIASVPIAILLITIIICSFYETCEPVSFLFFLEKSPKAFLKIKIQTALGLFVISVVPLVMAFIIFHHELWYIPVIEVVVFCLLIGYNIVTKYAFYQPNHKPASTRMFNAIGIFGTLFPILLPLVVALTIWFYYKSLQQLKAILHDFN